MKAPLSHCVVKNALRNQVALADSKETKQPNHCPRLEQSSQRRGAFFRPFGFIVLIGLFRFRRLMERQSDAEQLECVSINQTGAGKAAEPLSLSAVINGGLLPYNEHHITVCLQTASKHQRRKDLKNGGLPWLLLWYISFQCWLYFGHVAGW